MRHAYETENDADRMLPDATSIPHTARYHDGFVHDWTGSACRRCDATGGEHRHPLEPDDLHSCQGCGGTGEAHGPVWRWDE